MKLLKWFTFVIVILALTVAAFYIWQQRPAHVAKQPIIQETRPVTIATIPPTPALSPSPTAQLTKRILPAEVNLPVPFTPQAPHAIWNDPYAEFCEEASVLMATSYLTNTAIPDAEYADAALLDIQQFQENRFGFYKDTNAEQTAIIIQEHFAYKNVEVKENPSVEDIQQALADGRVIIAPLAGRELKNPHFKPPGPLYHMLVIKGYTSTGQFITNDPGTKHGADFLYDQTVIMNAIHDWSTDGNINLGKKVVIIAG